MIKYLLKNNVIVRDEYFKTVKFNNEKEILQQISLISKTDRILRGYLLSGDTRLYSVIGKRIENFKVQLRRLKMDLQYREKKKELNDMDLFLLDKGEDILKQGYSALSLLKNIDYINIIKRSMNQNEICLGRTDETNLNNKDDFIEIGKLKNAAYNLMEEDAYAYFKRLRRRNKDLKIKHYIDEFVSINKLDRNSTDYINMLLCVPSDTLKQWIRYKEGKKKNSPQEYLKTIRKALEYEKFNV